jgi:salicylate hydroxylase
MTINGRTVVVAGGGIAGMAAALLLAAQGGLVTVVERVAAPGAVGAGLVLESRRSRVAPLSRCALAWR